MLPDTGPYPLKLKTRVFPKVWGSERWHLADISATSASGAGGQGVHSVIANGVLSGRTLRQADTDLDLGLADGGGPYPLILKTLTATEHLSVQVHPSPDYAAAHPGVAVKHECWQITDAAPGAVLYLGLKPGTTAEAYAEAVRSGAVVPLLNQVTPEVGDTYTLPSGLVHALGPGLTVFEVQTASDTTFRVHDWRELYPARPEREMHVEQAIAATIVDAVPTHVPAGDRFRSVTPYYKMEQLYLDQRLRFSFREGTAVYVRSGQGTWDTGDKVRPGDTWLIPAGITGVLRAGPRTGMHMWFVTLPLRV